MIYPTTSALRLKNKIISLSRDIQKNIGKGGDAAFKPGLVIPFMLLLFVILGLIGYDIYNYKEKKELAYQAENQKWEKIIDILNEEISNKDQQISKKEQEIENIRKEYNQNFTELKNFLSKSSEDSQKKHNQFTTALEQDKNKLQAKIEEAQTKISNLLKGKSISENQGVFLRKKISVLENKNSDLRDIIKRVNSIIQKPLKAVDPCPWCKPNFYEKRRVDDLLKEIDLILDS